MKHRINHMLNIIMGSTAGLFLGHCIFKAWHYNTYPGLYRMQSAPWYTSILLYGALTGLAIVICFILKILIKYISK